jgi:hypothetical protein
MQIFNLRAVTLADETGEREAVAFEGQIEGDELAALRAADLSSPTQPSAADSRAVARPLAEHIQAETP